MALGGRFHSSGGSELRDLATYMLEILETIHMVVGIGGFCTPNNEKAGRIFSEKEP
jgi:hypothetical protein